MPPRAVLGFLKAVQNEKHELHSFMLLKNGKVICERWWAPYAPQYRHQLFSLSKSFTSTAIGIAADEGRLTADTPLADIFKDEFEKLGQAIDDEVRGMTVKNLLTMSTGMEYEGWTNDDSGPNANNILSFLSSHVKDAPGKTFRYSSIATYMQSAIITRLTGETLADYLKPRLFEPLGINPYWEFDDKTGVHMGGFGLNITTEDIAKFGQLYLQKGVWEGRRLISEAWVEEATGKQIENQNESRDWGMGYGYQFWRCVPEGVFRGDGMFGQFCVVVPSENIVIAITSNVVMQRILDLLWDMLGGIKALPADGDGADELAGYDNFSHLAVGEDEDAYPEFIAEYEFDSKQLKSVTFDFMPNEGVMSVFAEKDKPPAASYLFNKGQWTKAAAACYFQIRFANRVATYGAWSGRVFTATVWYFESACRDQFRFTFSEDFGEAQAEYRNGEFNSPFQPLGMGKRKAL